MRYVKSLGQKLKLKPSISEQCSRYYTYLPIIFQLMQLNTKVSKWCFFNHAYHDLYYVGK